MANIIGKLFRTFMIDRNAKNKSVADLTKQLETSNQLIANKLAAAADTEFNRGQVRHVIGIERWGQNRLKVALGEPFKAEEHDGYLPNNDQTISDLAAMFTQTRQETLAIAKQLANIPNVETQVVVHNAMGDMTVRSWLQYLDIHGPFELRKVS